MAKLAIETDGLITRVSVDGTLVGLVHALELSVAADKVVPKLDVAIIDHRDSSKYVELIKLLPFANVSIVPVG